MAIEVELNIPPHKFVVHVADASVGPEQIASLSNIMHHWIHEVDCFQFEHATSLLIKVMEELDYGFEDDDPDEDAIEEQSPPEHRFRDLL